MENERGYRIQEGPVKPLNPIIPVKIGGEDNEIQEHTIGTDDGESKADSTTS